MTYAVKEIFYTLQGEGANTGRPAVFCRFAGCNLWTGREADRAGRHLPVLRHRLRRHRRARRRQVRRCRGRWPAPWPPPGRTSVAGGTRFVVCTGGEPLLQLDPPLLEALHAEGFEVAVETNGTVAPPAGIDWLCVSPKAGAALVVREGNELKLVYPQDGAEPERFEALDFDHFFLQPMDGPGREANTAAALRYCLAHPRWRLSLQTHKLLGIP